ncbi:exodeoxyribonuclease VII large subunit [Ferruginibacter sp. HRS2-29]|uniref:exodeoxyribonuclease VII large subunit n=1 Tax=Ferruginibacter sp. HRS2-29 TaxID=2487334 RepID=UPI0020CD7612|nr:exodeoxyribonuclease VII large subunit [Ferruginibacter sp. HRS2-29]
MDGLIRSKILRNQPVVIRVIVARTGTIEEDIRKAIGFLQPLYNIDYLKTALDSPALIIAALTELDKKGADIICISRGGGDLEIFNDNDVCRKIVGLNAITGSAIGHASDENLFDLVADKKFATPTAFGNYLKLIHQKTITEIENNKNELNKNSAGKYQEQIKDLKESVVDLQSEIFAANRALFENSSTLKKYERRLKSTSRNNRILTATAIILTLLLAILHFI